MLGKRAFANRLVKDSNVDVRHRLAKIIQSATSSTSLRSNSNTVPSDPQSPSLASPLMSPIDSENNSDLYFGYGSDNLNSSSNNRDSCNMREKDDGVYLQNFCDSPINEIVDPIDYEVFIQNHNSRIAGDLKPLLLYPTDDVQVEKYQPPLRTLMEQSPAPEFNNLHTSDDPFVQSFSGYSSKTLMVTKKYEKCTSMIGMESERLMFAKQLAKADYEIDNPKRDSNSNTTGNNDPDTDSLHNLDSVSETPATFYSGSRRTTRPHSIISSASTHPPIASFSDDEDECKTPLATDYEQSTNLQNLSNLSNLSNLTLSAGNNNNHLIESIPAIDGDEDCLDSQSLLSNGFVYTESKLSHNSEFDKFNTLSGSKTKSAFSLQNSESDPHIKGILDKTTYSTYFERQPIYFQNTEETGLYPIFCVNPLQSEPEMIESRPEVPPPSDVNRYRLMIKSLSLRMDFMIEPIFASIAIYDAKERKKVTENFYFDLNPEAMKRLLRSHVEYQDLSTLSRSAIFSLSHLSSDMYFVIKLEKVLQGDINDILECYAKPPEDHNKLEKLKVASATNCERLGKYRMLFAWTAIPLLDVLTSQTGNGSDFPGSESSSMNNDVSRSNSSSLESLKRIANEYSNTFSRKGSLERHSSTLTSNYSSASLSQSGTLERNLKYGTLNSNRGDSEDLSGSFQTFKPVTITSKMFYRHESDKFSDDDLYKFLQEFKRQTGSKKLRSFPGNMKIDISPVMDENSVTGKVNPELVRLHPYPDERVSPVKELLEFRELHIPHLEYRNLLFVYPKSLNFTNRQGSARNISIRVQLLSTEEKFSAMPVIFGKSSCPELISEAYTAVNYHNKSPNFSEEIKIRLPAKVSKQCHLLFTFIHVHTKPKSETNVDEIVGYSWLPLWREDRLQTGAHSLPVSMETLPPGYSFLTPLSDSPPNIKWIDNHKPLFTVQVDSYSSIFAQDPFVDRFFRITSSLDNQAQVSSFMHSANLHDEFSRAIRDLTNSNMESLVKFINIILNRLIHLMTKPPSFMIQNQKNTTKKFQTVLFETMVSIVNKLNKFFDHQFEFNNMRTSILSTFIQYQAVFPQSERFFSEQNHFQHNNEQINFRHSKSLLDDSGPKNFYEEITYQWLIAEDHIRDKLVENSVFWFDIIYKSLCVNLSLSGGFVLPPRKRFGKQYQNCLEELIRILGNYVYDETKKSHQNTSRENVYTVQNLNQSLGFFMRDLLSVCDRTIVFNLIKLYLRKLSVTLPVSNSTKSFIYSNSEQSVKNNEGKALSDSLFELSIDFLRVIGGYEHFVTLNLPFGTPLFNALEQSENSGDILSNSSLANSMFNSSIFSQSLFERIRPYAELTDEYRRQHWLLGVIFCNIVDSFTKTKVSLHLKSINLIRSMLTSFDWDERYQDPKIKSRIACLFFPLVGITIDVISQLHDPNGKDEKGNPFYSAEMNKKFKLSKASIIDDTIAMAIAGNVIPTETITSSSSSNVPTSPQKCPINYQQLNEESTRVLLTCFLWVIGNVEQKLFQRFLTELSNERLLTFLEILRMSLRFFEYEGEKKFKRSSRIQSRKFQNDVQKLEDVIRFGSARRNLMRRRDYSQSFGPSDNSDIKYRWRKESSLSRYNSLPRTPMKISDKEMEDEVILETNLCSTLSFIVLDTLSLLSKVFRERTSRNSLISSQMLGGNTSLSNFRGKYASDEFVVASIFHAFLQLLSSNQSANVLEAALHFQRAFLFNFPDLLFVEGLPEVEFCSELCYSLLKHCASRIEIIRSQASASMYLLMRQHHQFPAQYSRIKTQITMSLSQLVGTSRSFNELYIRRSLKSILKYAIIDSSVKESQFPKQIHELIFNLHMILSDTIQMKEHEKDPEMLIDLMYRVAKGYQNSPELRLTWLENMSQKHVELSQHVEAAQCLIHASALVSECLHRIARKNYLPTSCIAFQRVCPNVFEESLSSSSDFSLDKSSVLTDMNAKSFSENGFTGLLERAANLFHDGSMFEAVNESYKLLLPVHEAHHRYSDLSRLHGKLHDVFKNIELNEGKRVFATYFRVGFYGNRFGDLDGEEFVYKEPFLTKLPEISHRLENFYTKRFGAENVEVIKDSNSVDTAKLDPKKAYIQITYVEPYFDSWELETRQTSFERNYNIKRFIYSTPFTLDGRAHGQLYEQCKRKTIMTTIQAFPYVKTRVTVQDRHTMVLSPIEVAIEDLQKKTNELANAANAEPVDPKILQMVLQGCVGTTVNQGPAEIAIVFLSDEPNTPPNCQRPPPALQQKLRQAFNEFSNRCGEALRRNRQMVGGSQQQIDYHKQLELNFETFVQRLAPLMGSSNHSATLNNLRKSYLNSGSTLSNGF